MPIGDYTKEEVRDIAKRKGLPVEHLSSSKYSIRHGISLLPYRIFAITRSLVGNRGTAI